MFEFEDNFLVVDELLDDPASSSYVVARIGSDLFMIHRSKARRKIDTSNLQPFKKQLRPQEPALSFEYFMCGMIPRSGFDVEVGRPITSEELGKLCKKYNFNSSNEFDNTVGAVYGKYMKKIKSIQIGLPSLSDAFNVAEELRNEGIEASNVAPGCVNIRTDWGGYREGAGRKPTGRKLKRIYATDEEEAKLREYLATLRIETK